MARSSINIRQGQGKKYGDFLDATFANAFDPANWTEDGVLDDSYPSAADQQAARDFFENLPWYIDNTKFWILEKRSSILLGDSAAGIQSDTYGTGFDRALLFRGPYLPSVLVDDDNNAYMVFNINNGIPEGLILLIPKRVRWEDNQWKIGAG